MRKGVQEMYVKSMCLRVCVCEREIETILESASSRNAWISNEKLSQKMKEN